MIRYARHQSFPDGKHSSPKLNKFLKLFPAIVSSIFWSFHKSGQKQNLTKKKSARVSFWFWFFVKQSPLKYTNNSYFQKINKRKLMQNSAPSVRTKYLPVFNTYWESRIICVKVRDQGVVICKKYEFGVPSLNYIDKSKQSQSVFFRLLSARCDCVCVWFRICKSFNFDEKFCNISR